MTSSVVGRSPDADGTLAELVAAAALGCLGVAGLSSGRFAQFAMFASGRRLAGVRVSQTAVDVGVVAVAGIPIPVLDAELRAVLQPLVSPRVLDIHVEDVQTITPLSPPPSPALI